MMFSDASVVLLLEMVFYRDRLREVYLDTGRSKQLCRHDEQPFDEETFVSSYGYITFARDHRFKVGFTDQPFSC